MERNLLGCYHECYLQDAGFARSWSKISKAARGVTKWSHGWLPNHVLAMVAPKFSMCRYFTRSQFHPVGDLPKMGNSSFVTTLTDGFMVDISTLGFVYMYVHCNWTNLELRGPTLWYVPRFAMDNCLWKHTVFFSRYSQPIFPLFFCRNHCYWWSNIGMFWIYIYI